MESIRLWLRRISTKPSPSGHRLELLWLRRYLLRAERVSDVLLGKALAIRSLLTVSGSLGLLNESGLLRIERLLWLLLLKARLLIRHSSGLSHRLLILFNGIEEIDQIRSRLLLHFRLLWRF